MDAAGESMKMFIAFFNLLRLPHWVKNLLVFFPPFFAGTLPDVSVSSIGIPSFLSFSLAASCCYIINDIQDAKIDKRHSRKRLRAIAHGEISVPIAIMSAIALYVLSLLIASSIGRHFEGYLVLYLIVSMSYTFIFKNIFLVDIFFISFGFLIRVLAGGAAFGIAISNWLFLTVFTVSLLLATGKRLGELISLGEDARDHRAVLSVYTRSFLDGMLWFFASAALVMYALYALEHKNRLFSTVPLAAFGLLRYIFIVQQGKGDPTDALLKDGQITGVGLLWVIVIALILYG